LKKNYKLNTTELIKDLANKDKHAIEFIYKQYYPTVRKMLFKMGAHSELIKDIFQEAIIILYFNLKKSTFSLNCNLKTYFISIVKNLFLNELKKTEIKKIIFNTNLINEEKDFYTENTLNIDLEENEQLKMLEKALQILGNPCKKILELFYLKNLSMTQIAQIMGYTNSNNAKTQKYKCLLRLKKIYFKLKKINYD